MRAAAIAITAFVAISALTVVVYLNHLPTTEQGKGGAPCPAPFEFVIAKCTGGDKGVSASDFASHQGAGQEWLEAKYLGGPGGQIWYVHADLRGAVTDFSGAFVTLTTNSDPQIYPQGVATYNTTSKLMTFEVKSIPNSSTLWAKNVVVGDMIACYPLSSAASWPETNTYYWSGNCEVNAGEVGVGHFVHLWSGGSGVNGASLPACLPNSAFEAVFSLVTTGQAIEINDFVCQGVFGASRYQVGSVLWFDSGGFEDLGSTWDKPSITERVTGPTCVAVDLSIPTSRGTLVGEVDFSPYLSLGGCTGEDSSLAGTLSLNGTSYKVLGVMSEFRCTQIGNYC